MTSQRNAREVIPANAGIQAHCGDAREVILAKAGIQARPGAPPEVIPAHAGIQPRSKQSAQAAIQPRAR